MLCSVLGNAVRERFVRGIAGEPGKSSGTALVGQAPPSDSRQRAQGYPEMSLQSDLHTVVHPSRHTSAGVGPVESQPDIALSVTSSSVNG